MNQSKNDYTVKSGLLGALGALWAGTPTSVSPIRFEPGRTVTNEEKSVLAASGVCDTAGQVVPDLKPALDVLGNAQAFTRMYITGGPNAYEYLVYFTADSRTASLINIGEDVQINSPAISDVFLEMAAQNLGSTVYQNAQLDATLTPDEALAFSGLLDLQRKAILRALADETEVEALAAEASAISVSLAGKDGKYQWLGTVMKTLLSYEGDPSTAQIQAALDSLAGKGLVKKNGSSVILFDEGLYLARRMLVFDTSLVLTAGFLGKSGTVSVAGFTCLQAGVHDLLLIDASSGSVALQSISSAGVLDYVRQFLTDPATHKKLDAAGAAPVSQPPSAAAPGKKFCPSCGTTIQQGKKFCPQCGAKVD